MEANTWPDVLRRLDDKWESKYNYRWEKIKIRLYESTYEPWRRIVDENLEVDFHYHIRKTFIHFRAMKKKMTQDDIGIKYPCTHKTSRRRGVYKRKLFLEKNRFAKTVIAICNDCDLLDGSVFSYHKLIELRHAFLNFQTACQKILSSVKAKEYDSFSTICNMWKEIAMYCRIPVYLNGHMSISRNVRRVQNKKNLC